ncbi:hypothetical protein [Marispirochaeta sp.]|jgi:hypothetical protein|uniref:hypothetical protein n=1 Tax=Marispirochaeta sp. TaxID=2038653 RepID=UPI0029C88DE9|nr:hypothetical protein [Marispirochaeta sp.]
MHHSHLHHGGRSFVTALAVLVGMCTLSFPADAEETVLHLFQSELPDSQVEELLYLAAGVELTRAGLSSSRSSENAEYTLHTRYHLEGNSVSVSYRLVHNLSDTGAEEKLAETGINLRINHYLDSIIASTIGYLVRISGISSGPSSEARIEGILPEHAESGERPGEAAVKDDTATTSRNQPAKEVSNPEFQDHSSSLRMHTAAGAGALMLFGDITEYFHYGAAGTVFAGMEQPWREWSILLGARVNLIRVFNDKLTSGAPLYVTTGGVSLQFGRSFDPPYQLIAGLSGGAALITVAESGDSLTKTVPYGEGIVSLRVPLGRRLYAGPELSLLFIFDDDILIRGFLPSLSAGMEF